MTKPILILLCCYLFGVSAPLAHAGQLSRERARRVSKSGRLDDSKTKLYPVDKTAGDIWSSVIRATRGDGSIKALRLHFAFNADDVNQAGQAAAWQVIATDLAGNELWQFDSASESDFDDFWSSELPTDAVAIRIVSKVPNSVLKLVCDKRIEYLEPIQEKSIVGEDNSVEITRVTNQEHVLWGRSVARLTFVIREDDQDEVLTCTGFLVAPQLFVTNEHCPRGDKERKSAIVEFDYDVEKARTKIYRLKTELLRNEDLDFAFYELNRPVSDRASLKFATDAQSLDNQKPLIIIQHPAGLPKRLAAINCQVKTSASCMQPPTDFGHECDTQGGSSGSPVQNNAGLVIGIHHLGFDPAIVDLALQINQAVKIDAIIDFIKKEKSVKAQKVRQFLAISQ